MAHGSPRRFRCFFTRPCISREESIGDGSKYRFALSRPTRNLDCDLAVEELTHYREVVKLLMSRGIQPGPDRRDTYIRALNQEIRRGSNAFLIDRLLVGAIVEYRGNERFSLVAHAVEDPKLKRFYENIAESEARHFELFLELADLVGGTQNRLDALLEAEARILSNVPLRAALH